MKIRASIHISHCHASSCQNLHKVDSFDFISSSIKSLACALILIWVTDCTEMLIVQVTLGQLFSDDVHSDCSMLKETRGYASKALVLTRYFIFLLICKKLVTTGWIFYAWQMFLVSSSSLVNVHKIISRTWNDFQ